MDKTLEGAEMNTTIEEALGVLRQYNDKFGTWTHYYGLVVDEDGRWALHNLRGGSAVSGFNRLNGLVAWMVGEIQKK